MVIKICKRCGKQSNHQPFNASGWIDYICNPCLGLPLGVPHPRVQTYHGRAPALVPSIPNVNIPHYARPPSLMLKLKQSIRCSV